MCSFVEGDVASSSNIESVAFEKNENGVTADSSAETGGWADCAAATGAAGATGAVGGTVAIVSTSAGADVGGRAVATAAAAGAGDVGKASSPGGTASSAGVHGTKDSLFVFVVQNMLMFPRFAAVCT